MSVSTITTQSITIGNVTYLMLVPSFKMAGDITVEALKAKLEWLVFQGLAQRIQECKA